MQDEENHGRRASHIHGENLGTRASHNMSDNKRIYRVSHGDEVRLIEATSAAAAIQHCAKPKYVAVPVKTRELRDLYERGIKVEVAKPEPAEQDPI